MKIFLFFSNKRLKLVMGTGSLSDNRTDLYASGISGILHFWTTTAWRCLRFCRSRLFLALFRVKKQPLLNCQIICLYWSGLCSWCWHKHSLCWTGNKRNYYPTPPTKKRVRKKAKQTKNCIATSFLPWQGGRHSILCRSLLSTFHQLVLQCIYTRSKPL